MTDQQIVGRDVLDVDLTYITCGPLAEVALVCVGRGGVDLRGEDAAAAHLVQGHAKTWVGVCVFVGEVGMHACTFVKVFTHVCKCGTADAREEFYVTKRAHPRAVRGVEWWWRGGAGGGGARGGAGVRRGRDERWGASGEVRDP